MDSGKGIETAKVEIPEKVDQGARLEGMVRLERAISSYRRRMEEEAELPPGQCYGCDRPLGPRGAKGWHAECYRRQQNIEQTGDPKTRRVWRITRHQRRRLTHVSKSRAGR